eukprot:51140-Karenia_brevis.AAC.1
MKILPKLVFKDVIQPLLMSQQMQPDQYLMYVKPIGASPNFEQKEWLQNEWSTLCQGKLTKDASLGAEYLLLSFRSTMQYETDQKALADWDIKSQVKASLEKIVSDMHGYPFL